MDTANTANTAIDLRHIGFRHRHEQNTRSCKHIRRIQVTVSWLTSSRLLKNHLHSRPSSFTLYCSIAHCFAYHNAHSLPSLAANTDENVERCGYCPQNTGDNADPQHRMRQSRVKGRREGN